jgi:Fe-S cluster assembly iron-binding protein IscA
MAVTITSDAVDLVRRSLELAKLDPSTAAVRLRLAGGDVRPNFVTAPLPDDLVVESDGVRVFVDRRITDELPDFEIAVSAEHERLIVRPVG